MKRLLLSLLLLNLLFVKCYADNYTTDGNYSIALSCDKAPTYIVKVPQILDVTNENTIMYFYVKGDIYGDQTLRVVFDTSITLTSNNRIVPVTVSQGKSSWTCSELSDSYVSSSVFISHQQLNAGTWSGYMNVAISLQGGN